jgi:DNA-binding transcriptional ArsR family regulator
MSTPFQIDNNTLKAGALVLRAVNHKLRQQMLRTIKTSGTINVTTLYKRLKLEQSVASQHLRILREAGFVNTERNGKEIYYSINFERFEQVDKIVQGIVSKA